MATSRIRTGSEGMAPSGNPTGSAGDGFLQDLNRVWVDGYLQNSNRVWGDGSLGDSNRVWVDGFTRYTNLKQMSQDLDFVTVVDVFDREDS